ncbi:MAG: NAD(P)-dependent oxidoreductase [Bacteroidia bacterium]
MRSKHHILIIDHVHPVLLDLLQNEVVVYKPDITDFQLAKALKSATVLIMRSKLTLSKVWIDQAPKLQYIGRLGSGMDNIDVAYAESRGIVCENAPEGNRNAVAEQTMGMLLSLLANVPKASAEVAAGIWDRKGNQGVELQNLTVGIIGYGHVGSRLAEVLAPFGCRVLAYDKFVSGYGSESVQEVTLEVLQKEADIVSLHVPLNEYSREMINAKFVEEMKKPFYILNLSRGEVVNISNLIRGLETKKIVGAGLDVLPNEKLDNLTPEQQIEIKYLSSNQRVVLTPHIGGLTKDSYRKLAEVLGEKVLKWMNI